MRVLYVGNFAVLFCTEQHMSRAFEDNGCTVIQHAQDSAYAMGPQAFVDFVLRGKDDYRNPIARPDLLVYTRSHSSSALGPAWTDAWKRLEAAGVKTASFHLDRFWDLPREQLIFDRDPLFTVQHVFTADGGNDERWKTANVNHHWLPPGVDRLEASWEGREKASMEFDVVFCGSGELTYHREYPQRGELIAHLRSVYGMRFAHFGHYGDYPVVRQQDLNDLYASCKVIVGDSCFGNEKGSPRSENYWSDRIPETLGRGGFLLHPWVPGLRAQFTPGELATYAPGDWEDLDTQIGAFLANPGDRDGYVERGRRRVLADHTYTVRARTLLDTVGLATVPA